MKLVFWSTLLLLTLIIANATGISYVTIAIDIDVADELMSSFEDHYEILQTSLNKLIHNADDAELINTTFRSMHTVKGNAAMMQITPLVDYAHEVEEAISAMRSGYFAPTPTLCDLLLTAVDRLRDLHTKYLFNKEIAPINEKDIARTFGAMANARSAEEVDVLCKELISLFAPPEANPKNNTEEDNASAENESTKTVSISNIEKTTVSNHKDYLELSEQQQEDLILFRILSLQVDEQNDFWNQRTDLILYLALRTIELTDKALDKTQLVAAVYMHDAGMAFVPDNIVNKNNKLNAMETKKLQQHPVWGYNLLKRMAGWEDAAQIVLEHHERIDGEGYPYQKKGDELTEGAKLLAILDAYYAMTNLRADRSHRRSIMRAISEINACIDTQFCSYWVSLFNDVIRAEVKAGNI
ncbi:MAG: HD domain-containing phosphohydrolase [Cellvibrionaceae bacterium]